MTSENQLESWESAAYAAQWAGEDVIADMLDLPRQISVAIVADAGIEVTHIVDLGSGPGAYLVPFLRAFPNARATWIDVSDAMRELAERELAAHAHRVTYVVADAERLGELEVEPAQVVLSSRALHHFSPESLQDVYRAAFDIVTPGGFVMNLDHVGAPGDWEQVQRRIRAQFTSDRKRALKPHRHDYPLARADEHGAWMEAAGFGPADTPWRMFYSALVVARKAS
ncbi:MAG: class I SAM-dependent methyltransferase [Thermoleophilia bacterium]|nr:class I SAM-dependent methyltransferase [Thermoleophilia bacterium]